MRNVALVCLAVLVSIAVLAFRAAAQEDKPIALMPQWALHIPDKIQPPAVEESKGPIHVPGSAKTYTAAEIDDLTNPPDWFPDEHSAVPSIIQHAKGGALACGSCHLMSGHGHPESADLAGLPLEYLLRQMADFKSGARVDPARMSDIGKALSTEDARQAAEWFASLKPSAWVKVVEKDMAPKSYVATRGRMRLAWTPEVMEPIRNRIIELPEDAARATSRDPHSGFIAYVPPGSLAKGEELVKTGGSGKTIPCAICHGDDLKGIGDVPRIAGLHPDYLVRQLWYFQGRTYNGTSSALMKKVVAKLYQEDILAIGAYVASLAP
jgi:cytochrome c553